MKRDYGKEIDQLRREIRELKKPEAREDGMDAAMKFFGKPKENTKEPGGELAKTAKRIPPWGMELAREAIDKKYQTGFSKLGGIYQSPAEEGNMWNLEYPIDELLGLDESVVEKILSAIGNRARIRILKAILQSPSNANELVAKLELNTTGKAYHHLNLLENADLVHKDETGRYHFRGHRVAGFFAALSCVKNAVDEKYTTGHVEELPLGGED